jgi:predicted transcriptional regulator
MTPLELPVSTFMSAPVVSVVRDTPLTEVVALLAGPQRSAVPVLDEDGAVVGVISRTDLIREGMLHSGVRPTTAMALPANVAEALMSPRPIVVADTTRVRDAAALMLAHHVHRVFAIRDGALVGVLSSHDVMRAIADARLAAPLSTIMSSPLITVDTRCSLAAATELLASRHLTGVVVLEEGWPVGVFGQSEALASRELPRGMPIDEVFDPSLVCLPEELAVHRAAATAFELGARRVIACRQREAVGIVTGMDFIKLAAAR